MTVSNLVAWLPVLALPAVVVFLTPADWPRWGFMWLLAGAIALSCKWLTWLTAPPQPAPMWKQIGYVVAWPGMDAPTFLFTLNPPVTLLTDWLLALGKFALGITLVGAVYPCIPADLELVRGWVGMVGILFVLHFGLFHLLSLAWRAFGVTARPIMDWPVLATSVSDFWGRRWNTAFRDLTHRYLFRPLAARLGGKAALLVGFFFSGLLHDLVISIPAEGGYGGPTIFFMVQAGAIFCERSAHGRRFGLGKGALGWAFTMFVLLGPLPLLFHPPFVRDVVVPFLDWIHEGSFR
jgi:Membrane bound O-acyl transferase family